MSNFQAVDQLIKHIAPKGYIVAINVRNTTPQVFHCTYDEAWWNEYSTNRYRVFDPTVHWACAHTGTVRWSEVTRLPLMTLSNKVMKRAMLNDLCYGMVISRKSVMHSQQKSMFSAARNDREFTDAELAELQTAFTNIADTVEPQVLLLRDERLVLEASARGLGYKETALEMGKSVVTVKVRLASARKKLGAKNTPQAVLIANASNLISLSGNLKW